MYGQNIRFKGEAWVRPYDLNILYRDFVVLHNMHLALQRYGRAIVQQRNSNPGAYINLKAILMTREYLIEEIEKILDELSPSYRISLRRENAESVERDVMNLKARRQHDLRRITGNGPISHGFDYDTNFQGQYGRGWIELDRDQLSMARNYNDILQYRELLDLFRNPQANVIDAERGIFKMFSIGGLTDGIQFKLRPKPYRGS